MKPVWILTLAIFAPVLCGLAGMLLPRKETGLRVLTAALGPACALFLLGEFVRDHGFQAGVFAVQWMPTLKLNLQFNADQLGLFFAFLVSAIGLLIILYARAYFGNDSNSLYRFYPSLLLFMTAMLGVALSDNFMLLLLFWEMTSISSFLLIGWERDDPSAVKKAMQAFVVTGAGGLAMMAGLILMGTHTGVWSFTQLIEFGPTNDTLTTTAFLLIFAGAAAKSAQFPLHFWLPGAMAAPTPVSAYLHSATMVKAGVYLTGRMWPILATTLPLWSDLVTPLGAITMVYGAFIALQKKDLKQIFAYTTVSQLGLLMCMYGLAGYNHHGKADFWEVTQILNHALYKAPLFILAGAIGHVASRDLTQLKGFFWRDRNAKIMAAVLLLAAYGLAAGPGTLSFTAKEFFFHQIYHVYQSHPGPGFQLLIGAGIATGTFNVAIFLRLLQVLVFQRSKNVKQSHATGHDDHAHETGWWPAFLWIPGLVIVVFQFVGGLAPNIFDHYLLQYIEPGRLPEQHLPSLIDVASHLTHPELPLIMSAAAMALGVIVAFLPILRSVFNDPFDHLYPGFYTLVTKKIGPRAFGVIQRGHTGSYIAFVSISLVGLFLWSINFDPAFVLNHWPQDLVFEIDQLSELSFGVLLTIVVCLTAVLLPIVTDRTSRVLVLGTCGFGMTAVYYLYRAPDLALTQISIEIVSLILFLLVLSLIPREVPKARIWVAPRIVLSLSVGAVMFWLTLSSAVGPQPSNPSMAFGQHTAANLGEFFLRNSHHGIDTEHVPFKQLSTGLVNRETNPHAHAASLHHGGGGDNVVNVILVDFRGFDTMGEITVLALAAMGVWTLLRRRTEETDEQWPADEYGIDRCITGNTNTSDENSQLLRLDIPDPNTTSDLDSENEHQLAHRNPQP